MHSKRSFDQTVEKKVKGLSRRRPELKSVEASYEIMDNRTFLTKVKAKTRRGIIYLKQETDCLDVALKKVFTRLDRLLLKESKGRRVRFDMTHLT